MTKRIIKIIFFFIGLCPIILFGQIDKELDSHMASNSPNELGFYKVVLQSPVLLKKFRKWMDKSKTYHIVYHNKYLKLVAGANQSMVSRVAFILKKDFSSDFEASILKNQELVKGLMASEFPDIKSYNEDLENKAIKAAALAKLAEKRAEERRKKEEYERKQASLGRHCIDVLVERCDDDKINFRLINTCELPFRIKYSYLVAYKRLHIETVSVPQQDTISLKPCDAIHESFYFVSNSSNPFMLGKMSDAELALNHLIALYDDVYKCRACTGDGVITCRECGGRGKIERNGPINCYDCRAEGVKTCYNCKGKGVFGLD